MNKEMDNLKKDNSDQQLTISSMKKENQDQRSTINNLNRENKNQQSIIEKLVKENSYLDKTCVLITLMLLFITYNTILSSTKVTQDKMEIRIIARMMDKKPNWMN